MTEDTPSRGRAALRRNLAAKYCGVLTVRSMRVMARGRSRRVMAELIACSVTLGGMAYLGAREYGVRYLIGLEPTTGIGLWAYRRKIEGRYSGRERVVIVAVYVVRRGSEMKILGSSRSV